MNSKVNNNNIFKCNICNRFYSSKSSLCNHNKKFHLKNNSHIVVIGSHKSDQNVVIGSHDVKNSLQCNKCNKIFQNRSNRWRHEQKCNTTKQKELELEIEKMKVENEKIKVENELILQIKKEETKILQLKLKLEKSNKVDNITLKKLNKMLIERNTRIKNSNNTINSNNQQIINNFQLIGFGKEEVMEKLSNHDKKLIMNAKYNSLDKLSALNRICFTNSIMCDCGLIILFVYK